MKRFFTLTWIFLTLPIRRRLVAGQLEIRPSEVEGHFQYNFGISFWEMAVRMHNGNHPFQ